MEFVLGFLITAVSVIITAVVTAFLTRRTEHQRWLRTERFHAFSALLAASTRLDQLIRESGSEAAKIAALHDTEAAHADIEILGPQAAREAATGVLHSHVSERVIADLLLARNAFMKVAAKVLGT